jgi:hypothetical protein
MLTIAESETIRKAAHIRSLSVAEFIRRAALGRRADVRYEDEIVRQLSTVVRVIRGMHAAYREHGIEASLEEFRPVIRAARDAILLIANLR